MTNTYGHYSLAAEEALHANVNVMDEAQLRVFLGMKECELRLLRTRLETLQNMGRRGEYFAAVQAKPAEQKTMVVAAAVAEEKERPFSGGGYDSYERNVIQNFQCGYLMEYSSYGECPSRYSKEFCSYLQNVQPAGIGSGQHH